LEKKPEEDRQNNADNETGDDREVEGSVFAAMDDVAGEAAEAERETTAEIKKCTDHDDDSAEDKESAAEFTEGVHKFECKSARA
jgi:hypothetical protein